MTTCSTTGCHRSTRNCTLVLVAHVVDGRLVTRPCCRPCARQFLAGSGTTQADLLPLSADVGALRDRLPATRNERVHVE